MKLSITQLILGVLIVFAACFIVGWMTYNAPDSLRQPQLDDTGTRTYIDVVPDHKALFDVSRYGSYLLPALGILLIITGAVQAARADTRTRNLAVATLAAGALTGALAYIITVYGFPTSFHSIEPDAENLMHGTFINPGPSQIITQELTGVTTLLGLAVTGCGIAQLVKTWNKPDKLREQG